MTLLRALGLLSLALVTLGVALYTKGQRLETTNWASPVDVVIYPVNGDGSDATARFIARLRTGDFADVDAFLADQADRYDVPEKRPFVTRLGSPATEIPPVPPGPRDSMLKRILWSIGFRIWTWRHTPDDASNYRRVRVFAVYYRLGDEASLPRSVGMQKGLLGLVHVFADDAVTGQNNVVIAHEILHTVGAADKYGTDGLPLYPAGFADPDKDPLFPQTRAEIMAGTIPLAENDSRMPASLRRCMVGIATAREIGWVLAD